MMQNDLFFSFSFSADCSSKASEVNYQIFCQNNLDADQSSQKHTNSFIFLFALPLALCCAAYSLNKLPKPSSKQSTYFPSSVKILLDHHLRHHMG